MYHIFIGIYTYTLYPQVLHMYEINVMSKLTQTLVTVFLNPTEIMQLHFTVTWTSNMALNCSMGTRLLKCMLCRLVQVQNLMYQARFSRLFLSF